MSGCGPVTGFTGGRTGRSVFVMTAFLDFWTRDSIILTSRGGVKIRRFWVPIAGQRAERVDRHDMVNFFKSGQLQSQTIKMARESTSEPEILCDCLFDH
jgi:hypothetical protein